LRAALKKKKKKRKKKNGFLGKTSCYGSSQTRIQNAEKNGMKKKGDDRKKPFQKGKTGKGAQDLQGQQLLGQISWTHRRAFPKGKDHPKGKEKLCRGTFLDKR